MLDFHGKQWRFVLLRLTEAISEKSTENKNLNDYYILCQFASVININTKYCDLLLAQTFEYVIIMMSKDI